MLKYTRMDLAWEAVRRNENYKDDFRFLKPGNEGENFWNPRFGSIWRLRKPYDPDTSIDEIKAKIKKKIFTENEHPYFHLFGTEDANSAIKVELPPINDRLISSFLNKDKLAMDDNIWVFEWFAKFIIENRARLVISVNLLKENKTIFDSIKKIKVQTAAAICNAKQDNDDKLKYLDKKLGDGKGDFISLIRPMLTITKIDYYINALKRYDELVENYKQINNGKNEIIIKNGVVIIPGFKDLVPDQEVNILFMKTKSQISDDDKFDDYIDATVNKKYRNSYKDAVELIMFAPNNYDFMSAKKK